MPPLGKWHLGPRFGGCCNGELNSYRRPPAAQTVQKAAQTAPATLKKNARSALRGPDPTHSLDLARVPCQSHRSPSPIGSNREWFSAMDLVRFRSPSPSDEATHPLTISRERRSGWLQSRRNGIPPLRNLVRSLS